jgi:sensor histidine kinase YesM
MILLNDEMELIRAFVEIEKVRFGDRLTVRLNVEEELMSAFILPLTIQPLIENAIHHGVMKKEEGGEVHLDITETKAGISVTVKDNGIGMSYESLSMFNDNQLQKHNHVALYNIHRRLINMNGRGLVIQSTPMKGTTIQFTLPKEE